ncbi:MAG: hypothetical protein Q7U05_08370 [Polaromonas sp.]|nr:hypothetical protein [Polaromonas sp.]
MKKLPPDAGINWALIEQAQKAMDLHERIEAESRKNKLFSAKEIPNITNPVAGHDHQRRRNQQDAIETARQEEFARLEARDEYEALKRDSSEAQPIESNFPSWELYKPLRDGSYTEPLYNVLSDAKNKGLPRPTARDVVAIFGANKPPEIAVINPGQGFNCYTNEGNLKAVSLKAIQAAIVRMTTIRSR